MKKVEETMRRHLTAAVLAAMTSWGCFVQVTRVENPARALAEARAEAARVQGRPGPAHQLNIVAYDATEGQLVRVSLPMWMVRKLDRERDHVTLDLGEHDRRGHLRHRLRLDDIEKAGLGLLVEVDDERDGDRVLVWLK